MTYQIADGWQALRRPGTRLGVDELCLQRIVHGMTVDVWTIEIPPKMPEDELISQAAMLAAIYDSAFERGIDHARHAFQVLMDNTDLLYGEAD